MRTDSSHFFRALTVVVSLAAVAACATANPRTAPVASDDLVRRYLLDPAHVPSAPADLSEGVAPAWAALRAGDALGARQWLDLVDTAGRSTPGYQTAEGLLALSQGAAAQARGHLQAALAAAAEYPTALYGLGFLAEAEGNRVASVDWYRQAVAAAPSLSAASVRLQVVELEQARELIAQGEADEEAGDDAAALRSYLAARELGPEVLEPYLRTAAIERRTGDLPAAIESLRSARDRIGELPVILEPLGRALQDNGEHGEAYAVFQALEDVVPADPTVQALVAAARELYFTTDLPAEYRTLEAREVITREDLAALIAIQLEELADLVEDPLTGVIMVDVAGSWAEDYIREVGAWRVMEPFQNHAFRTDLEVSRMMFAEVAYRILEIIDATDGARRVRPTDVSSAHYLYDRILVVVGQEILPLGPRDTFGLLEPVSGEEATAAVQRLVRLARRGAGD